jgi:hypothetical protein
MAVLAAEIEDVMMTNAHQEDAVILVLETEVTDAHLKVLVEDEVNLEEAIDVLALAMADLGATEDLLEEETLDGQKALQVLRELTDQDVLDVEINYKTQLLNKKSLATLLRGFFMYLDISKRYVFDFY